MIRFFLFTDNQLCYAIDFCFFDATNIFKQHLLNSEELTVFVNVALAVAVGSWSVLRPHDVGNEIRDAEAFWGVWWQMG